MARNAETTLSCPECGGTMRHTRRRDVLQYKGRERTTRTTAWWCESCGEGILKGAALKARNEEFLTLKAEVDGTLAPAEVTRIRERLGMSQREAGRILGGGPRAFQKYESGTGAVSLPMSNLLRLLAEDPSRLNELRGRRD